MKRKLKCNVCGTKFQPKSTYEVCEPKAVVDVFTNASRTYDATDCPNCGCQKVLGVRIPKVQTQLGGDEND